MFTYFSIFRYFSVQQNSSFVKFFVFALFFCMSLDWKILIETKNNNFHYISEVD